MLVEVPTCNRQRARSGPVAWQGATPRIYAGTSGRLGEEQLPEPACGQMQHSVTAMHYCSQHAVNKLHDCLQERGVSRLLHNVLCNMTRLRDWSPASSCSYLAYLAQPTPLTSSNVCHCLATCSPTIVFTSRSLLKRPSCHCLAAGDVSESYSYHCRRA